MVHSKKDEKTWEESTLEPIAIVGMSELTTKPKSERLDADICQVVVSQGVLTLHQLW